MRGLYLLAVLVLLLPTTQFGLSFPSDTPGVQTVFSFEESDGQDVLLIEVCPGHPSEHIVIENRGALAVLDGWSISDGEGAVTLTNISLANGELLALAVDPAAFSVLHPMVRCIDMSSSEVVRSGRFTLADQGDCVLLYDAGGVLRDSLYFGKTPDPLEGWSGSPVLQVTRGHAAVRVDGDTDTAADWRAEPPGRSDVATATFRAAVEPFTAPEEARDRVLREISLASFSLKVAIYELTDGPITSAMCERARSGVDVEVLVEGQPVSGIDERCTSALSTLSGSGCDVKLLSSQNGYKRYDYLHCKYLVADDRRVLVMSENWANGLMQNRGWGAVCDDRQLARHMKTVFDQDFTGPIDVREPPVAPILDVGPWAAIDLPYRRYVAEVAPIVSPDNAEEQYVELLRTADRRLLVQVLYIEEDWIAQESLLSELTSAAARGVQVRVLLDSAWSSKENLRVAAHLNEAADAAGWDLEAKLISPYHDLGIVHNKGMIIDDVAVVSSLNWCDPALRDNREIGLAITSEEVSDYFAEVFWTDWCEDPFPPSLELPWYDCIVEENVPVVIDASNASDASGISRVEFDLGPDGIVDWNGTSWSVMLPAGVHVVSVTAYDAFNNTAVRSCTIEVLACSDHENGFRGAVLLAVPAVAVLAILSLKRIIEKRNH